MDLNELKPIPGSTKSRKRLGRGPGSGLGKTCGGGIKGQKSRGGISIAASFEGGQMPMTRRLPKRGFHNKWAREYDCVNVGVLGCFEAGAVVDPAALQRQGLVGKAADGVKLLGGGEIDRPLTIRVHKVSKGAAAKVEAAGGTVELLS